METKPRFTEEDIRFEDEIMIDDYTEISAYLCENICFDKIAGLHSQHDYDEEGTYLGHGDLFSINYYPTYNLETDSFFVEVSVTLDASPEEIREHHKDIAGQILDVYLDNKTRHKLPLTKEETAIIFEKFKDYCVKDCKDIYGCDTFDELLDAVRKDLEIETDLEK